MNLTLPAGRKCHAAIDDFYDGIRRKNLNRARRIDRAGFNAQIDGIIIDRQRGNFRSVIPLQVVPFPIVGIAFPVK